MKIAFYNLQNIFHRPIDLVHRFRAENRARWITEFERLLLQGQRSQQDFDRMRILSHFLGFDDQGFSSHYTLRNAMGQLLVSRGLEKDKPRASHLTDWEGWAKVDSLPIDERAIGNKAKVIQAMDPDILVVSEVESRASLVEFNRHFLGSAATAPYREVVFMETNDPFGRGMGLLAKAGIDLVSIRTRANELDASERPIFDTDLQEYRLRTASGRTFTVLCTHFPDRQADGEAFTERQWVQSKHIAEMLAQGECTDMGTILMGTLNAPAYGSAISPLIKDSGLTDITRHPSFMGNLDKGKDAGYFSLGAYKMGVNTKQRDYLMLSDGLFNGLEKCGLVRKGMWFKERPQWEMLGSIKSERDAASEHPLLWCQIPI
ncbi:MAG: hypothetical protein H2058_11845 [Muricauda sp.]|nr:hypothetical protein [Allomuricauda sp.]MBA4745938.1 hypothetical protein [Allomuricauda sp.]